MVYGVGMVLAGIRLPDGQLPIPGHADLALSCLKEVPVASPRAGKSPHGNSIRTFTLFVVRLSTHVLMASLYCDKGNL